MWESASGIRRSSGILLHISSLPSPYGIGSFGAAARDFVDFLADAGQRYWQILPLSQTGYGDSPYQPFSAFAGNPYFVDLDMLCESGLLERREYCEINWGDDPQRVDYGILFEKRSSVLNLAADRFLESPPRDFEMFCAKNACWLGDYALFMALKPAYGGASWQHWPASLRFRLPEAMQRAAQEHARDISRCRAVQYLLWQQWQQLKNYANSKEISIIGDMPIYCAEDSSDVWSNPGYFQLDEGLVPTHVAGCPPDGFSEQGQLWGNPLFDWQALREQDYGWWVKRMSFLERVYDVVRIDHFRGLEAYYSIPKGMTDAKIGAWRSGPAMDLIKTLREKLPELRIVAEDLGHQTQSLREFLKESGLPGMKVLEFAFDSRDDSAYLPHSYRPQDVIYTGTHDNEPLGGWLETAPQDDLSYAREYLRLNETEGEIRGMLRSVWASAGGLSIVQMQDILELGHESRMNTPSTLGGNWVWRLSPGQATEELAADIRHEMELYKRI